MPLSANRELDRFVDQQLRSYDVAASVNLFKGGFVGLNSSGFAQPLQSGDTFVGIAYEQADNSSGTDGALDARVFTLGDFRLTLAGALPADTGRAVYAVDDDTVTFNPDGNTFVGRVQDVPQSGEIVLRIDTTAPADVSPIWHHSSSFTLTAAQTGTVHTNLGAAGTVTATLPQSPPAGTTFQFVCMADQPLQIAPGLAGGIYIKGAKQPDNKYASVTDIGDFIHLIADGNGDWVAVASISGADIDITIEP